MAKVSLREKIFQAQDRNLFPVEVAEWGVTIFCRVMSGAERQCFMDEVFEESDTGERVAVCSETRIQATLIALCFTDEDGKRIFEDSDLDELSNKNFQVLERLFRIAQDHNKLTQQNVDELKKNFEEIPNDDSGFN